MLNSGYSLSQLELLIWGNFHGLQKISFREITEYGPLFAPPPAAAILGVNGSGKSTLIDGLMMALLPFENSLKLGVTNDSEAGSSGGRTVRDYVLGKFSSTGEDIHGKKVENFHGILSESWVDSCDFSDLSGTLIVENFETFFSLSSYSKNTLILWGAGWRAARLKNLKRKWPEPLFYWGDIDKEGYEIFAYLKKSWPDLQALYMNEATIKKYHHLIQKKESSLSTTNPGLKLFELQSAYDFVVQKGIQIEQEQLDEPWPFHPDLT